MALRIQLSFIVLATNMSHPLYDGQYLFDLDFRLRGEIPSVEQAAACSHYRYLAGATLFNHDILSRLIRSHHFDMIMIFVTVICKVMEYSLVAWLLIWSD
jgi:hypothetical protein